jgi:hypothetical protein
MIIARFLFIFVVSMWGASLAYADITTGLMDWWKFDDGSGTTAIDSGVLLGQTAHNGTLSSFNFNASSGWTSSGRRGGALVFDGIDDKVAYSAISVGTTSTVAAWIYPTAPPGPSGYGAIFAQDDVIGLWFVTGNKVTFFYSGNDHTNNTFITLNKWHHIAVVDNAGSVTFYLDGNADGTASGGTAYSADNTGNDPSSETFQGTIDDLRFYNRALSGSDVKELYVDAILKNANLKNGAIK